MRLLCRLAWHQWGRWTNVCQGILKKDGKAMGSFITQKRVCSVCGRVDLQDRIV